MAHRRQFVGVLVALGLVLLLWLGGTWPFSTQPPQLGTHPSLSAYLLDDNLDLGLVRLGTAAIAIYVLVSVTALTISGRWLKAIGSSGISVDDVAKSEEAVQKLQQQVDTLTKERDEALMIAAGLQGQLAEISTREERGR